MTGTWPAGVPSISYTVTGLSGNTLTLQLVVPGLATCTATYSVSA